MSLRRGFRTTLPRGAWVFVLLAGWLAAGPAPAANDSDATAAAALEVADPGAETAASDPGAIARRAEVALRGPRVEWEATLTVVRGRIGGPRRVLLHAWEDLDGDRMRVELLAPERQAGTVFLRLTPNVWVGPAKAGPRRLIAPASLRKPWLESDFARGDVLDGSSRLRDYDHVWLRLEDDADGRPGVRAHVLEYVPREDSAAAWARIVAWIEVEHGTPLRRDYYGTGGEPLRTLRFEDLRPVGGLPMPFRWVARPVVEDGRESVIELRSARRGIALDESLFAPRSLAPAVHSPQPSGGSP